MLKFTDRSLNELSSSMGLKVVIIENTIFQMDRKPLHKKDGYDRYVYHVTEKMSKTEISCLPSVMKTNMGVSEGNCPDYKYITSCSTKHNFSHLWDIYFWYKS